MDICPSVQAAIRDRNISGKHSISGSTLTSLDLASFPRSLKYHGDFSSENFLNACAFGEFIPQLSSNDMFKCCCSIATCAEDLYPQRHYDFATLQSASE